MEIAKMPSHELTRLSCLPKEFPFLKCHLSIEQKFVIGVGPSIGLGLVLHYVNGEDSFSSFSCILLLLVYSPQSLPQRYFPPLPSLHLRLWLSFYEAVDGSPPNSIARPTPCSSSQSPAATPPAISLAGAGSAFTQYAAVTKCYMSRRLCAIAACMFNSSSVSAGLNEVCGPSSGVAGLRLSGSWLGPRGGAGSCELSAAVGAPGCASGEKREVAELADEAEQADETSNG
eukprot:GHVT01076535.1.p1 GENE.GHVT01076535.1~~GHVT01076535.1.p1  ORF type:complete len:230 (-),score=30.40 GHVT01076535.1:2580-3269(-)